MAKRINWRKMNQITSLYEDELEGFRKKIEEYANNFSKQTKIEELKKIEKDIKTVLATLNNYKNLTIYHIEQNGYTLSKTLLLYFDEKDKDVDFLKEECYVLLSKVYSNLSLKEKDAQFKDQNKFSDVQVHNNPCVGVTKREKIKRCFKLSSYRTIQLMFVGIVIVFIILIISSLSNKMEENSLNINNFDFKSTIKNNVYSTP